MVRAKIIRIKQSPNATLGRLFLYKDKDTLLFDCATLELPWKDNQNRISRIPTGTYEARYEWSPHFGRSLWELKGVPGRSEVKFHSANYARQLLGCIALGNKHIDIDQDGITDVTSSNQTMQRFHKALENEIGNPIQIETIDLFNLP